MWSLSACCICKETVFWRFSQLVFWHPCRRQKARVSANAHMDDFYVVKTLFKKLKFFIVINIVYVQISRSGFEYTSSYLTLAETLAKGIDICKNTC